MNALESESTDRFFEAIQGGDVSTVESLLAGHPGLLDARSHGGLRPVTAATYSGATAVTQLLIERGAELDIFDAAALGNTDRLHDLLHRQPDLVHAYSDDGWTPLHLAGHFGRTDSATVLLEHGADLAAISHNRNGNTPLHAALAGRQAVTAKLLIERGADVNVADGAGYAPLHLAAHEGNVALVRMLLDAGADPRALTVAGQTPFSMAEEEGHDEVADLLRV
jgi:ankyrin repeat protein